MSHRVFCQSNVKNNSIEPVESGKEGCAGRGREPLANSEMMREALGSTLADRILSVSRRP